MVYLKLLLDFVGLTLQSSEFFFLVAHKYTDLRSIHTVIRSQRQSSLVIIASEVPIRVIERDLGTANKSVLSVENCNYDWLSVIHDLNVHSLIINRVVTEYGIGLLSGSTLLHYD